MLQKIWNFKNQGAFAQFQEIVAVASSSIEGDFAITNKHDIRM